MTMTPTTPAHTGALDPAEARRLERLERTVGRAIEIAGKIAGEALATIRDERLYRATHSTFDEYCRERWGVVRRTVDRWIEAATAPELAPGEAENETPCLKPSTNGSDSPTSAPGRPDSPFVIPDEPMPTVDACRVFARVIDTGVGVIGVRVDEGTREYPEVGQRVLLVWER